MHFKGLDLNLLVALDVLLQEKNTTRAAERLNLSQPAASGALSRLREYFNDDLLAQAGRQLVLTPLATSLREPVSELLRQIETTISTKARFNPATSTRRFTVMGSDYAMTVLMMALLNRVEQEAPGISFVLRQTTNSWQEELKHGTLDFVMIPDMFTVEDHPKETLFDDDFTCVIWAENPLIGPTISTEQYLALGHAMVAFGKNLSPSIEQLYLQQAGFNRRVEIIAPSFALLPLLVLGTNRIATMHTRQAKKVAQVLPLRLLPLPIALPRMTETLQWSLHHSNDPGSLWLREILRDTARSI
jgi:LysR family transcriptional regulator, nod-box dependent transcriptional activator